MARGSLAAECRRGLFRVLSQLRTDRLAPPQSGFRDEREDGEGGSLLTGQKIPPKVSDLARRKDWEEILSKSFLISLGREGAGRYLVGDLPDVKGRTLPR